MAISSVSSNINNQVNNIKQNPTPPVRAEKENDGDKDDGGSTKVKPAAPAVNSNGQTTGTTINVTA